MKHFAPKVILLTALLACSSMACTSSKSNCKPDVSIINPAVPQAASVTKYARWLPNDALGVLVIDVRPVLEAYLHSFEAGTKDPKVGKARRAQVMSELSALSTKRLGLDLTKAKQIVVGVGLAWQSVVITGIKSDVPVTGSKKIDGFETFKLASSSKEDEMIFKDMPIYGFKLTDDNAVVMVTKPAAIEGVIKTKSLSLANEPKALKRLVGLMPKRPARISFAMTLDNPIVQRAVPADQIPFALPNAVSMEFGDKLSMKFHGQKADLQKLHQTAMDEYGKWFKQVEENYNKRESQNIAVAMLSITTYHNAKKLRDILTPTFTDATLSYQYDIPDQNGTSMIIGGMGAAAAIAIPLFFGFREASMKAAPAMTEPAPMPEKVAPAKPAQPTTP